MIDFSTLQGLTIPEGVVTQIEDASGRVLWSAEKKATVTIHKTDTSGGRLTDASKASVTIDGIVYDGSTEEILQVAQGTVMDIHMDGVVKSAFVHTLGEDGSILSTETLETPAQYTINDDITIGISVTHSYVYIPSITISKKMSGE